jgi:hypothetical protein
MPNFTAGTSFTDGVTNDVTAAKLNALVADAVPTSNLSLNSTTGTIATFNSTTGTIATLNSTTGTIANLNSTTGTIATLNSTTPTFLGAITASTNTINVGSGQIYKDASGRVGIGTSSPSSAYRASLTGDGSSITGGLALNTNSNVTYVSAPSAVSADFEIFNSANGYVRIGTNNTERLRIDSSGNLLVGKTSPSTSTVGFQFDLANNKIACGANGSSTALFTRNGDDGAVVQIARDGSQIGTISATTTAVAYNTSSDYRLKTNLEPISNGIERVKQLPVYRFNWIADQSGNKVDGFVAHEAQAIVPECVTGEKDAVDADGKPVHQGIDQSKIVPLLTAALKEAIAKIETLEAKVTALEAA